MSHAVQEALEGRRVLPVDGGYSTDDPPHKHDGSLNAAKHFQTSMSLLLKPIRRSVVPPTAVKEHVIGEEAMAVERPATPSAIQQSPARSERSRMGLSRFTQVHGPMTVTEQELSCIRRVATYSEPLRPDGALVVPLPTCNYWLRHLHDPRTHKPPAIPLNLLNMPTDCYVRGLPNVGTMPLINSPRSVLVLMKHGTDPLKLQQRLPNQDTYPTHVETGRQEELQFLKEEYRRLCAVLPLSTVSGFYEQVFELERRERELSSKPDSMEITVPARPTIQADDNGIYRVVLRAETTAAERAVADKLDRSRSRVENRLRSDVQLTQARTEASKVMQKKALAANKKHEAIAAQRRREHEAIRLQKSHAMEEKRRWRDVLAEELKNKAIDAHERRMVKNQELEEANEQLRQARKEHRHQNSEAKAEKRLRILEQARQLAQQEEKELQDLIASKEKVTDLIRQERELERTTRCIRIAESEEKFKARREAMQRLVDQQMEVARKKHDAREAAAERLIQDLERTRKQEAAHKEMQRLQRTLMADEKQAELEVEEEARIQEIFVRWDDAGERQQRLMTILDQRRQEKRFKKNVDSQDKKKDQDRWDAQRQFESMLSTDGMLSAQQRLEAVQKARVNISENAKKLEMEMSRWRVRCAEEARQMAEREEREVTLSLFNLANPSDAVTLKAVNEGSIRRLTRRLRRPQQRPMEEPHELEE